MQKQGKTKQVPHPNLVIQEGDVLNPKDVRAVGKGKDQVILTLGSGKKRRSRVRSQGTKHIIEAVQQHGVKRRMWEISCLNNSNPEST